MAQKPMDRAAAGLEKMGAAATRAVELYETGGPQWFALLERAVDIAEAAAVKSGLGSLESIARVRVAEAKTVESLTRRKAE